MKQPLIECNQIYKRFEDKNVVKDVTFSLNEGQILCIVGPSGCGKTTFLRCVAGLEELTSGEISIEGKDITQISAQDRPVVMMFQQPLLFPHLSIIENTMYGLRMKRISKREISEQAMAMLKSMEIEELAESYPHEISGGQQQRVALARALILQPRLLLLDEPFSSLDPELRTTLRSWVKKKLKEWNTTAIFVTHDKEEAMVLADKIAVMKEGAILQMGKPEELYDHPSSLYVANYMSEGFSMEGRFIPLNKVSVKREVNDAFDLQFEGKVLSVFYKGGQRFVQLELVETGIEVTVACHIEVGKMDIIFILINKEDTLSFDS